MRIGYSSSGGGGEKCPAGFHVAVLAAAYDIGRQKKSYAGDEKIMHQVILVWEVDKRDSKGRRFTLTDYVTASTNEKSGLTKRLTALLARTPTEADYDTDVVIGKCAYLMIKAPDNPEGWPRIDNLTPLPPGFQPIKAEFKPDPVPKYVENARAKAVGGWKAPRADQPQTPTPPNKSAPAGAQGGALPSREPGDDSDAIAAERAGSDHPF